MTGPTVEDLRARAEAETEAMLRTGTWPSWLRLAARFPQLGCTNTVLVWWQQLRAQLLGSSADWSRRGRKIATGQDPAHIITHRPPARPCQRSGGSRRAPPADVTALFDLSQTLDSEGGRAELVPAPLVDGCPPRRFQGPGLSRCRFSPVATWAGSDSRANPDRAIRSLSKTILTAGTAVCAHLDAYIPRQRWRSPATAPNASAAGEPPPPPSQRPRDPVPTISGSPPQPPPSTTGSPRVSTRPPRQRRAPGGPRPALLPHRPKEPWPNSRKSRPVTSPAA